MLSAARNVGISEHWCWLGYHFTLVKLVIEESCSLVDLFIGFCNASVEVHPLAAAILSLSWPSKSSWSMIVKSKQSGSFQSCHLVETLGQVAALGTYLIFVVKRLRIATLWWRRCTHAFKVVVLSKTGMSRLTEKLFWRYCLPVWILSHISPETLNFVTMFIYNYKTLFCHGDNAMHIVEEF